MPDTALEAMLLKLEAERVAEAIAVEVIWVDPSSPLIRPETLDENAVGRKVTVGALPLKDEKVGRALAVGAQEDG